MYSLTHTTDLISLDDAPISYSTRSSHVRAAGRVRVTRTVTYMRPLGAKKAVSCMAVFDYESTNSTRSARLIGDDEGMPAVSQSRNGRPYELRLFDGNQQVGRTRAFSDGSAARVKAMAYCGGSVL